MIGDSVLAREARVLRWRLELGLVELEQIEEWADAAIAQMDSPHYELIELALARKKGADICLAALKAIGGEMLLAKEVVLAVASAEPDRLSYDAWHAMLSLVTSLAVTIDTKGVDSEDVSLKALYWAYEPYDWFYAVEQGYATRQALIEEATHYLKCVRDVASQIS